MIDEIQDRTPATTVRSILNQVIQECNEKLEPLDESVIKGLSAANAPSEENPIATMGDLPASLDLANSTMPIGVPFPNPNGLHVPAYNDNDEFKGPVTCRTGSHSNTIALRDNDGRLSCWPPNRSNPNHVVNALYLSDFYRKEIKVVTASRNLLYTDFNWGLLIPSLLVVDCQNTASITLTIPNSLSTEVNQGESVDIIAVNTDNGNYPVIIALEGGGDNVLHGLTSFSDVRVTLRYLGLLGGSNNQWHVG